MPRIRDYQAEYRRRIERERERATAEGREFSRAKARGHTSNAAENARRALRRRVYRLADQNIADGIDYSDHGDRYGIIDDALRERKYTVLEMVDLLEHQQRAIRAWVLHDPKVGRRKYRRATPAEKRSEHRKWVPRRRDVPEVLFYYHGNY